MCTIRRSPGGMGEVEGLPGHGHGEGRLLGEAADPGLRPASVPRRVQDEAVAGAEAPGQDHPGQVLHGPQGPPLLPDEAAQVPSLDLGLKGLPFHPHLQAVAGVQEEEEAPEELFQEGPGVPLGLGGSRFLELHFHRGLLEDPEVGEELVNALLALVHAPSLRLKGARLLLMSHCCTRPMRVERTQ